MMNTSPEFSMMYFLVNITNNSYLVNCIWQIYPENLTNAIVYMAIKDTACLMSVSHLNPAPHLPFVHQNTSNPCSDHGAKPRLQT